MRTNPILLAAALITGMWMGCGDGGTDDTSVDLDAGGDSVSAERLPCNVETVLAERCQDCHSSPPANGAPFSLLTYANTQADYFGEPVFIRMQVVIENDIMPPSPREKLGASERSAVLDWIEEGAKPAGPGEACP